MIIIHNTAEVETIIENLERIEDEIERCIEAEDFDTMADWIDARSTWHEDLYLVVRYALENQS